MSLEEIAREAFQEAWKQVWGEAVLLIIGILALLGFLALAWIYLEYISIRPRR